MNSLKSIFTILAFISTSVAYSACLQKTAPDSEGNMATLNLMVLETDVKALVASGFQEISCEGIPTPKLAKIEEKCSAMLAMPKELQANFFNQFQISIEKMCKVSKKFVSTI